MNCIFNRRSIRKFKKEPVEPEKIERILKAAMQAPSAHDFRPWEFLVIKDEKALFDISKMSPFSFHAEKAPLVIIIMANLETVKTEDLWWVQDLSACTENALLQVTEEGLGGVWMGFFPEEKRSQALKNYFALPEHVVPFSIIALGYPDDKGIIKNKFDSSKIHYEKY